MSTESSRRAAISLIRRGIAVIPVPSGEKNPGRPGWQSERISEEDVPRYWTNGQNVGVLCGEPSGGLVDVDLDVPEAAKIAGWFLSPTLTAGRERSPHSHWWYRAAGAESRDFLDTNGKKLVELRSTGRQTLVEPSVHPSGDRYLWHRESGLEVAEIDPGELSLRCTELATAVLISRYLPPHRNDASGEGGGRHDYALALAGFLLRPGRLDEARVLKILKAAWHAKGWPSVSDEREALRDLEGVVRDTPRNLERGRKVKGGGVLEKIVPGMACRIADYWGWDEREQEEPEEKEDRRNQADRLIGYALEDLDGLFTDQHGAPHALVEGEPVPLTSRCYSWLRRLMWEHEERAVNGEYLKTAAGTLAAHAEFSGEVRAVTLPLPHIGRPILNASGAMGSGKTTIGRVLKRMVDPTAPETVRLDPRDFLQKASHAYLVMLDNQNTIPEWAADTLCRLVTGEADSKRRLYTDDEDVIIELRRAVLLNGINVPTDRGDVLDRSLVVELERIPDGERKTEEEMWERFEEEHPKLLGALFDVLSKAIALKPSLKLSRRPRLADWGEYAAAVYEVMGWGAEAFLKDWDEVVKVQNQATLGGSPVAQAVIKFMQERDEFDGSSSELHAKLKPVAATLGVDVDRDKAWPKSARWLWRRIKEVLPLLVAAGIEANRGRDNQAKQITLRKVSTNDGTDGTDEGSGAGKAKISANTTGADGTSNGTELSNGTEEAASSAGFANSADTANRYGDFSETPTSFDAKAGEDVTIADLKVRREIATALQQLFDMHPETRKQTPRQIAEDLYIWTDLGYEPDLVAVEQVLAQVGK